MRVWCLSALLIFANAALGQTNADPELKQALKVEVISLKYTIAADLIPVLQPLVTASGHIGGMHNQLILRTTAANLLELKSVIYQLDRAPRQLRITVRQDVAADNFTRDSGLSASARVGDVEAHLPGRVLEEASGRLDESGAQIRYRSLSTRSKNDQNDEHVVLVLEGRAAFIETGQSVPIAEHEHYSTGIGTVVHDSIAYRDLTTGFHVLPRLQGNSVSLDIYPYRGRLDPRGGGAFDIAAIHTTTLAPLGKWVQIGSQSQDFSSNDSVNLTHTRHRGHEVSNVWVRVDEVR